VNTQTIKRPPLSPLKGILLMLLIFLCIVALLLIGQFIAIMTGNGYVSLVPWLLCALFAFWIIKKYLLGFCYTVSNNMVYLERLLGSHRKLLDSFSITSILEFGDADEIRKKYPEIKKQMDMTLNTCELKKVAYYYKGRGDYRIAILQPDDEMKSALWDIEKRRLAVSEKWG